MSDPGPPPGWQPPPKRRRGRGCFTAIGIAVVVIIGIGIIAAIAGGGDDDDNASGGGGKTQTDEVTITSCGPPDTIGVVYVKGEAENTSSKRSDYLIEVAVVDADGTQLGTGSTIAQNVDAGQTALWSALTDTPDERWAAGATCTVVDVERNASL